MDICRMRLLVVIVFLCACSDVVLAQVTVLRVPVNVLQGAYVGSDTFGFADGATYCIDPALGESELPPRPPTGVFDVRFVDHRDPPCLGQGVRLDLQPYPQNDTFQLAFQKGDGTYSFTISWPLGLNAVWNSLKLTDILGLGLLNVNMFTTSSVTITQTFISSVYIIASVTDGVQPERDEAPRSFSLSQNYPNPFNPSTTIRCGIAKAAYAEVAVYDVLGRRIATLLSEERRPGFYTTNWNGSDDRGVPVASGMYYVRMVATGEQGVHFSAVRKLLLMR